MKIRAFNIRYDIDDDSGIAVNDLPGELTFWVDDHEDIEDEVSELISDHTGFCHKGFNYQVLD